MPTLQQKALKIIQENIKNLEIIKRKPKTRYHIIGGVTYGNAVHQDGELFSKKELDELNFLSRIPKIVLGPVLYDNCQLCGADLNEIREAAYPKLPRHVEKFCTKNHMIEYSKRKKIRTNHNATGLTWNTYKGEQVPKSNGMIAHLAGTRRTYKSRKLKFKKGKRS